MIKKANFKGVGIDVVDVNRFNDARPSFFSRFFTKEEIKYCKKFKDAHVHFAGHFAAKEAVLKALAGNISIEEIEIFHNKKGQPKVLIKGKSRNNILISISHNKKIACAIAIL